VAHAHQRFDELRLTVTLDARESQHLTFSHVERDVIDSDETTVVQHDKVANFKYVRAGREEGLLDHELNCSSDHHGGEFCFARARLRRSDHFA